MCPFFVVAPCLLYPAEVPFVVQHGVFRVDPAGEAFDPNFHEAVMQMEDETLPEGSVAQVMQVYHAPAYPIESILSYSPYTIHDIPYTHALTHYTLYTKRSGTLSTGECSVLHEWQCRRNLRLQQQSNVVLQAAGCRLGLGGQAPTRYTRRSRERARASENEREKREERRGERREKRERERGREEREREALFWFWGHVSCF
jgi:hypothetical protein